MLVAELVDDHHQLVAICLILDAVRHLLKGARHWRHGESPFHP